MTGRRYGLIPTRSIPIRTNCSLSYPHFHGCSVPGPFATLVSHLGGIVADVRTCVKERLGVRRHQDEQQSHKYPEADNF